MNDEPEIQDPRGVGEEPPIQYVTNVSCWRCHLEFADSLSECVHCGAENRSRPTAFLKSAEALKPASPIKVVMFTYGILLASSILMGLFVQFGLDPNNADANELTGPIFFVELIDSAVVLIALAMTGLAFARIAPLPSFGRSVFSWVGFGLAMPLLIWFNLLYHRFLLNLLEAQEIKEIYPDSFVIVLLLYCFQPAIIEELFSRQMCLSVFREIMGVHASVFITALMFALLHIFTPFSMGYLFLLGIYLGYARILSGTIWLPIVLHFVHNLIVVLIE